MTDPVVPTSPVSAPPRTEVRHWGGIGRLAFVTLMLLVSFVKDRIIEDKFTMAQIPGAVMIILLSILIVSWRLKNIGAAPRRALLFLVPGVNLVILIRCLVEQQGYEDTKEHDLAGRLIMALLWAFLLLIFVFMIYGVTTLMTG